VFKPDQQFYLFADVYIAQGFKIGRPALVIRLDEFGESAKQHTQEYHVPLVAIELLEEL
jgi:hypothetical protein